MNCASTAREFGESVALIEQAAAQGAQIVSTSELSARSIFADEIMTTSVWPSDPRRHRSFIACRAAREIVIVGSLF